MGQIAGKAAGMDDAPVSITLNHSQISVHKDVTAIPAKHAGQISSRRKALRNRETAPVELPACRWWNAAVICIKACRKLFSGSSNVSQTLSQCS